MKLSRHLLPFLTLLGTLVLSPVGEIGIAHV